MGKQVKKCTEYPNKCWYKFGFAEKILWISTALTSSITVYLTEKEIHYEICPIEASFVICSTLLLLFALETNRIEFIIPWIILAVYNIYYSRTLVLEYLLSTHYYEIYGNLAIAFASFLLGLKLYLWTRIFKFIMK